MGFGLAAIVLASLAFKVYLLAARSSIPEPEQSDQDKKYIAKAISWKAKREHASEELIARLSSPSIVKFRTEACVQLAPASGVAGGRTVMCFHTKTGRIFSIDEIGQ